MKNRSHMESQEQRLKRFISGPPHEAIDTLLESISNYFNNEIALTKDNFQTSLLFLGIHASILTLAYVFYGDDKITGFKQFLVDFVDGESADKKFSSIAVHIYKWRNTIAHRWLGSVGHLIGYDYSMKLGWQNREDRIFINPKIYCDQYLSIFSRGGKIWDYSKLFSTEELKKAKTKIIEKYLR